MWNQDSFAPMGLGSRPETSEKLGILFHRRSPLPSRRASMTLRRIITIGPVIVFCFLTLTFVLGILRQRRRHHLAAMAQNVTDPMPRRGTSFAVFSMLRLCLRRSSSGGQAPPRPSPDPQAEQLKETPEGATMHGAGDHPYPILLDDKSGKTFQMRSSDTFASPSLTAAGIARVEERPALELPRVPASSGKHAPEPGELDNSEHVSGQDPACGARRIRQPGSVATRTRY